MIEKFTVYTKNAKENKKHNVPVIKHNYIIEITGTKNSLLNVLETLQFHGVTLNKNLISMTSTEDLDYDDNTFILRLVADSVNDLDIILGWVSDNIDDEVDIDGDMC